MRVDTFSNRLRIAMEIRDIKGVELSERSGISPSRISQYLKGTYEAKQNAVYVIAKTLDVSEAWIMGYDVNMDGSKKDVDAMTDEEVVQWFADNDIREVARTAANIKAKKGDMRLVMKMLKMVLEDDEDDKKE